MEKQLVVCSGPSCIGKGPMLAALVRIHGKFFVKIILYTSRPIRTSKGEVQDVTYHFRSEDEIKGYRSDPDRYIVAQVRSDWQAIDMKEVAQVLADNDLIVVEVYPTLGKKLLEWVGRYIEFDSFKIKTVAIVPMSDTEIDIAARILGTTRENLVYMTIKGKLERRASESDTADKIEERSKMALGEIEAMADYSHRIINHAGEDRVDEWADPLGPEAARVVGEFFSILSGEPEKSRP